MNSENGCKILSISVPKSMWDDLQEIINNNDELGRSRFVQSAIRLKIKMDKIRNVTEFVNSLDEKEVELLKSEIKKRS